ncbi:MAG: FAD-dependent oxidoreductase, partial [Bacilli bacterium]
MIYDVIIVGGGTCGCMAALHTSKAGLNVLLLDHKKQLLSKLRASGNGRCNITNNKPVPLFVKAIQENGKFCYPLINKYGPNQIMEMALNNGLDLKEEVDNKMFPCSDDANDVAQMIINQLDQVNIKLESHVLKTSLENNLFQVETIDCLYQSHY